LDVEFRISPTRRMVELHAVYEDGELRLPDNVDPLTLKDSRVKVVVTVRMDLTTCSAVNSTTFSGRSCWPHAQQN
jgi:alanine racemase